MSTEEAQVKPETVEVKAQPEVKEAEPKPEPAEPQAEPKVEPKVEPVDKSEVKTDKPEPYYGSCGFWKRLSVLVENNTPELIPVGLRNLTIIGALHVVVALYMVAGGLIVDTTTLAWWYAKTGGVARAHAHWTPEQPVSLPRFGFAYFMITGDEPTHYDFLDIPHDANMDMVKMAYHRSIRQYHPDKKKKSSNSNNTKTDKAYKRSKNRRQYVIAVQNEDTFMADIALAYSVLSDPYERCKYDMGLRFSWLTGHFCSHIKPASPAGSIPLKSSTSSGLTDLMVFQRAQLAVYQSWDSLLATIWAFGATACRIAHEMADAIRRVVVHGSTFVQRHAKI